MSQAGKNFFSDDLANSLTVDRAIKGRQLRSPITRAVLVDLPWLCLAWKSRNEEADVHASSSMCWPQAQESSKRGVAFPTMRAVPGNLGEHATAEEEMFLAAALFGLAGTPTGVTIFLKYPEAVQGDLTRQDGSHVCPTF